MSMARLAVAVSVAAWLILTGGCASSGDAALVIQPTVPKKPVYQKAPRRFWGRIRSVAVLPLVDAPRRDVKHVASGHPTLGRVEVIQYPIQNTGQYVQNKLMTAFVATSFQTVERSKLAKVLDEQDLRAAFGDVDATRKAGRLVGADAILVGEVHELLYVSAWKKGADGSFVKLDIPTVSFSVRLIDVLTGRTLWSCSCSDTGRRFLTKEYTVTVQAVLADPHAAAFPLGSLDQLTTELADEAVRTLQSN